MSIVLIIAGIALFVLWLVVRFVPLVIVGLAMLIFGGLFPLLWRWLGDYEAAGAISALIWLIAVIVAEQLNERRERLIQEAKGRR